MRVVFAGTPEVALPSLEAIARGNVEQPPGFSDCVGDDVGPGHGWRVDHEGRVGGDEAPADRDGESSAENGVNSSDA